MPKSTFFNLPDAKRSRIVELAIDEFSAHSFHEASLSRIVARAGIAKGSIYQYFDHKLELYRWLLLDLAVQRRSAFERELEADPDALAASVRARLRFAIAEPRLARLLNQALEPVQDPELRPLHHEVADQTRERCRALLTGTGLTGARLDDVAQLWCKVLAQPLVDVLLYRREASLDDWLEGGLSGLGDDELEHVAEGVTTFLRAGAAALA